MCSVVYLITRWLLPSRTFWQGSVCHSLHPLSLVRQDSPPQVYVVRDYLSTFHISQV